MKKKILRLIKDIDISRLAWFFLGVNVYCLSLWPLFVALSIFLADVVISIKLSSME